MNVSVKRAVSSSHELKVAHREMMQSEGIADVYFWLYQISDIIKMWENHLLSV